MVENPRIRLLLSVLTTGGILLLTGCGNVGQSPLAPVQDNTPLRAAKPGGPMHTTVSTSSTSLTTATSTTLYVQSASGMFSPTKVGSLRVSFPNYASSPEDILVKEAIFEVFGGSLTGSYKITMDVYSGRTLQDVNVVFGPSGVVFNPPARLTISLRGPVTDDQILAQHICADGTTTVVTTEVICGEVFTKVIVDVPGFSRYSLGGNDFAPETQPF